MVVFLIALFILSVLVQIVLMVFIFSKILNLKNQSAGLSRPAVSIVLAAHNEKKNLEKLVPLLLRQNYPNFEVIVANDRSDDGSNEWLESINDPKFRHLPIRQTPDGINPKKHALSNAIEASKNQLILLTDADCYPISERWIELMVSSFENNSREIVLGYSPYESKKGFLNLLIRYETLLTAVQYLSFALAGKPYMGVGRNMAYTRSIFEKSGKFTEIQHLTGGDDDLFVGKAATAENTAVCIDPQARMYSVPKDTWGDFRRQKIRHLSAGKNYSTINKLIAGLYPISGLFLYFSMIILSLFSYDISYILSIFILRTLVLIIIFALITRKLQETINWIWLPVLDLFYVNNFVTTGISAFFSKNIKWR